MPHVPAGGDLRPRRHFAIGIALVAGLFTRVAALGSLALLFTYVMSGTASVCAFYALFAIVILVMWRTSSWIGIDGLIAARRQRYQDSTGPRPRNEERDTAGTAAAHPAAWPADGPRPRSVSPALPSRRAPHPAGRAGFCPG